MNKTLLSALIALAAASAPAFAADVGISITIGQPGFYGQIDLGDYPHSRPEVIYAQPRVVLRSARPAEPIYLRVPPGHRKNWRKHCRQYNACGERVYFVQDNWYQREYIPQYQNRQRDRDGRR